MVKQLGRGSIGSGGRGLRGLRGFEGREVRGLWRWVIIRDDNLFNDFLTCLTLLNMTLLLVNILNNRITNISVKTTWQ